MIAKIIFILSLFIFVITTSSQTSRNSGAGDSRAIKLAENVMKALGGKRNWDNTRYICWNFFGRRFHIWDKWSGNLRLEEKNLTVLMNINTRTGHAWDNSDEITHPDSLRKIFEHAYAAWINDSYWMFMPYKLRDSGVTLQYKGEGETLDGKPAEILQLSFKNVGLTPNNKYHVYVDKKSNLVVQFDYFQNAGDDKPAIQAPWKNWERYGNIMLSDDRGNRKMTDVAVFDELPEKIFTSPENVDRDELIKKQRQEEL